MENISSVESFDGFKNRIKYIFEQEGNSDLLQEQINIWHGRRQENTDKPGGKIKERVEFQIELAQIYLLIGKNSSAFDTLSDAFDQASQEGLHDLSTQIEEMMGSL